VYKAELWFRNSRMRAGRRPPDGGSSSTWISRNDRGDAWLKTTDGNENEAEGT